METIPTQTVLDRGAKYLGNHPDDIVRRIALATLLVDAKAARNIEAAVMAFRFWAHPNSRVYTPETILGLANDKVRPHANSLHE